MSTLMHRLLGKRSIRDSILQDMRFMINQGLNFEYNIPVVIWVNCIKSIIKILSTV